MSVERSSDNELNLFSDEKIKVVCKIKPKGQHVTSCRIQQNETSIAVQAKLFSFDFIANENITQEEMFGVVGQPYAQACLEGYNGTILCYGQTGSGKTFTMFGQTSDDTESGPTRSANHNRGLVPRVLEYL